jgi:c-di-GMP-binding flagellar brake protein YcgR
MKNIREFFRLNIGLKVFIKQIRKDATDSRFVTSNKWKIVKTKNISAGGMYIDNNEKNILFKVGDFFLIKLKFPMFSEAIILIGKVLREDDNGYAVKFTIVNERDRDKLINIFYHLSYEKNPSENI